MRVWNQLTRLDTLNLFPGYTCVERVRLCLTRNADLAIPVHFDDAHEKLIEEERSTQDKFQIKQYF